MTETISLREANQRFARLVRRVEEGEEFVVTRRGQPVARIIPAVRGRTVLTPEQAEALASLDTIAAEGWQSDDAPLDRDALHER
jgi:prevent-host-death family protein